MTRALDVRIALIFALLFASAGAFAAVDDLTEVIPAGAPMVAYVADAPKLMEHWAESPIAALWNDPQVQRFFGPLVSEMEADRWDEMVREETGYSIEEIKGMLAGDVAIYVENLDFALGEKVNEEDVELVMLITLGDNASDFEELILRQEEEAEDGDEEEDGRETSNEIREFRDIELHVASVFEGEDLIEENAWAVIDGVFAVASSVESLEAVVGNTLDGGVDEPLRSGTNFATVAGHTENADGWFFFDIEPWVPLLRKGMEEGLAAAAESGSPFPMDADTLADALGFNAMQALFATVDYTDQALAMDFGMTYTEDLGLMKLIAYGPEEAPRPTFIPIDSDAFSSAHFDFATSWSTLVDIVNGINPSLMAMAAMQLQSMVQGAGAELDLGRDVLDNLTGEMISIQNLEGITGETIADLDLQQDQVFVLGVQQRQSIENAIETLKTLAGEGSQLFRERDFEGHTVFSLDLPQAEGESEMDISYTITDSHLFLSFGTPATLEKILLNLAGSRESVWKVPEVRRALGHLPEGGAAVSYHNLAETGHLLFSVVAALDSIPTDDDGDFPICDPSAVPDSDIVGRYLSSAVSGVWKNDREIVIRSLVLPAEDE